MPSDGVPSRSNATDVASIVASPSTSPAASRRGRASTSACTSRRRERSSLGGRVDYTPTACFVTYQPSAVASPMGRRVGGSTSTIAAIECVG